MVFIKAGQWVAIKFKTNARMFIDTVTTMISWLRGLTHMTFVWHEREQSRRARNQISPSSIATFPYAIAKWLQYWMNTSATRVPIDFEFAEPKDGGSSSVLWRLPADYSCMADDEEERVIQIGFFAAIARGFMHPSARNSLFIERIKTRQWGRLVSYCKANLGESSYATEKHKTRGLPTGTRKQQRPVDSSSSSSSDEDKPLEQRRVRITRSMAKRGRTAEAGPSRETARGASRAATRGAARAQGRRGTRSRPAKKEPELPR
jgi:hypothetical protein